MPCSEVSHKYREKLQISDWVLYVYKSIQFNDELNKCCAEKNSQNIWPPVEIFF